MTLGVTKENHCMSLLGEVQQESLGGSVLGPNFAAKLKLLSKTMPVNKGRGSAMA